MVMMKMSEQAQVFMDQIQSRRRDPAKAKTVKAYRSYLDNWVLPLLGSTALKDIENGALKSFVARIHPSLAPTTVTAVVSLVKQIVASAVDANGNQLYPRTWNNDFMDLPIIKKSALHAPTIGSKALSEAISRISPRDQALYSLLAGSGLRIGEALALHVPDWDRENAIIHVNSTRLPDGSIQNSPKTEAGRRQVDLVPELNQFLASKLGAMGAGSPLFPCALMTAYARLEKNEIKTGFHAFRRFRITHLEDQNVPTPLIQYWAGHSAQTITDRYARFENNLVARKQWAKKAGLGFELPL